SSILFHTSQLSFYTSFISYRRSPFRSSLFPYTTLFRSLVTGATGGVGSTAIAMLSKLGYNVVASTGKKSEYNYLKNLGASEIIRSEEHTSELQSRFDLVCRLLLEKKKSIKYI